MAIIQLVLSIVVLGIVYSKMVRRETPEPVSKIQAAAPVIGGVISLPVSFILFLIIGGALVAVGISFKESHPLIRSFMSALMMAGIPEELAKLLFIGIVLTLFRSKIKNVYEYILVGAGVGFGFTLLEEFFYGSDGPAALFRIFTIAAHMLFGIIMTRHLALAKYNKANGKSGAMHIVLAILIPILIHTVFDTCTGQNFFLQSEAENIQLIGIIMGVVATIIMFIAQFVILNRLKKNTEQYCAMTLNP